MAGSSCPSANLSSGVVVVVVESPSPVIGADSPSHSSDVETALALSDAASLTLSLVSGGDGGM